MAERTCANCVEVRECELRTVRGKLRPLCAACIELPEHLLEGPRGPWLPSPNKGGNAAGSSARPSLEQLDRRTWRK